MGSPSTALEASTFSKASCYEIFSEPYRSVYSLIEIEHCILRARSASCNMFMSNWFTPTFDEKNVKWDFALLKPEPSLNVGVLNFGSRSCLAQVPILRLGDPPKLAK